MARRLATTVAERERSWVASAMLLAVIQSSVPVCGTAIVMNAWPAIEVSRDLDLVAAPAAVAEKPSPRVIAVHRLQMVVVARAVARAVATFSEVIISRAAACVATVGSVVACGCSSFLKQPGADPVPTACPAIVVAAWMKPPSPLQAATVGAILVGAIPVGAILVGAASLE